MKNYYLYMFWTILLILGFSCSSPKTIKNESSNDTLFDSYSIDGDYSKSAYEAIDIIKKEINSDKFQEIRVTIISVHNGSYIKASNLKKQNDSIIIETTETSVNGIVSKESKKYKLKQLTNILNDLLIKADQGIVIAGTYQNIIIDNGQSQKKFKTRKAWGLINIL